MCASGAVNRLCFRVEILMLHVYIFMYEISVHLLIYAYMYINDAL